MKKIIKILISFVLILTICVVANAHVKADTLWQDDSSVIYKYEDPTIFAEDEYVTLQLITGDTLCVKYYVDGKENGVKLLKYDVISDQSQIILMHPPEETNIESVYVRLDRENAIIHEVTDEELEQIYKKQTENEISKLSETGKTILRYVLSILAGAGVSWASILIFIKNIKDKLKKNKDDLAAAIAALKDSQKELSDVKTELLELKDTIIVFKDKFQENYEEEREKKKELNELIIGEINDGNREETE